MIPTKVGLICSNLKKSDEIANLIANMYQYKILPFDNDGKAVNTKKLNQIKNNMIFIPDVKNSEHIGMCDFLIFVPDFADLKGFNRKNKAREYSVWNEILQEYKTETQDDKMVINMNRMIHEHKIDTLAKKNHVNETIINKYMGLRLYVLFGDITMEKIAFVHNDIVGNKSYSKKSAKHIKKFISES